MKYLSLLLLIFLASCYGKTPEKTGLEGKALPSFSLLLMDSTTIINTQDISTGKPFVFFVFSPHCPYSRAQMQSFIDNIEKFKDINIYVFTIAPFKEVKQFSEKYQLRKYSNIITGIDLKNVYGQYMTVTNVPYIAIYDKNRKLKNSFLGETDIRLIKEIAEQ